MTIRSLTEAAKEVLDKSRASATKEGMKKLPSDGANGSEKDIGGASLENPEGNEVGTASASSVSQAEFPGTASDGADSPEAMKKLPHQPGSEGSGEGRPLESPEGLNGGQSAKKGSYMHPTSEETELSAEELEEAKKEKMDKMKEKMKKKSMKEDIDAILSGESFSEDFKTKLSTIFEAAVLSRAMIVVEEMEEEILAAAEESVEEIKSELEEQTESYLTVMVEQWKEENKLAIESGLKAEIMEDFLSGLKNLFIENYIELPSEKVDVVEALTAEVSELTEKLNNSLNNNVDLTKKINEAKKVEITGKVCEGLTATQIEKVKTLAEGVEFTTEGEYSRQLKTIRESYFNGGKGVKQDQAGNIVALTESSEEPATSEEVVTDNVMESYVQAFRRTNA